MSFLTNTSKIIFTVIVITLIFSALPSYSQLPPRMTTKPVAAADSCGGFKVSRTPTFPLQGYGIAKIKTFDVNHDGISDLLLNLTSVNKIVVQFGDGEGGISETRYFAAGDNPTDFDVGDFNRDGEIDIIVANTSANKFSLLLGDGAGNFSLYASYDTAYSPQVLKVGYFDSDNYLDVAVGTTGSLQIFKGNRDLTFNLVSTGDPAYGPNKIISGDFNKDGKTDLVITYAGGNSNAEIRLLSGKDGDSFDLTTTISGVQAYSVVSADVDRDGNLDLIASDYTTSKILTYRGNGDGSFKEPISSDAGYQYGLATIDFNSDGKLDLVTGSGTIYLGDGSGKFNFYANGGSGNNFSGITVADFNSDTMPDFAIVSSSGSGTSIISNTGKFETSPVVYVNRPFEVDSADFNGDGKYDLVTVSGYNNSAHVLLQDETGNFTDTSGYFGLPVGGGYNVSAYSVTVGDFNNDSKPDFAVPDAYSGSVAVFTGNGDGTFVTTIFRLTSTNVRPYYIRTGDFNNDGYLDIITTNLSSRDYSVLLNDGAGGFTLLPGVNINPDSALSVVTVGDITNDGILDLIVARQSLGDFIYLTGKGDGTFVRQPTLQNGVGGTTSFILTDLNDDKNLDLIIGGNARMQVSFGVGNGGFFDAVSYPVEGSISDLELQDFDLDGIKDVIAGKAQSSSLLFFKGKGNGAYEQAVEIPIDSIPTSLTSKDFNNDGKPDIGVDAVTNGKISVIYNKTNTLPCLSVGDAQINEGDSGTADAGFTVSLSSAAAQEVSVDYKTVSRTAAAGSDFVEKSGTLVFAAGTTSQTVSVTVNGDVLNENDETFTLTLSNPVNAEISDAVGVAAIADDDETMPNLSIGNAAVVEGSGGSTTAFLPVTLSGASGKKITVQAATKDVTAVSVQDYQPLSETIYFEPGEVSKNLPIEINPDYRVENNETFEVNLTNPLNVNLSNNQATVTITDDDAGGVIQFSTVNISVAESVGVIQVIVSRTDGNAADVGFRISTKDETATEFKDYAPINGVLTFAAGEMSKTVTIPIINDALNEDTEEFSISLANVTGGATLGAQKSITVSIEDDDNSLPRLSVADLSVAEGNYGTKSVNFRINLLAASGRKVTVNYATQNGTATAPEDYIAASGTIEFAPEETSKTIQLSIVGDTKQESDEIFSLVLSGPFNAEISRGAANITILNDDSGVVRRPVTDFDGDGRSDVSVYRAAAGFWYVNQSQNGFTAAQFGAEDDKIVPADYDGDGKTDLAVYRSGTWYLQRSTAGFAGIAFGAADDIPQPADFDGDGKADLAVFRPSNGNWYVYNLATGQFTSALFGTSNDKPVAADYTGDGKADYAVFRPSNHTWYIARPNGLPSQNFDSIPFGNSTDQLVPADYDGDGKTDIAVFRPSNGTWYRLNSSNGQFFGMQFGISTDIPVPADFDGDGRADIAVFRSGIWYIQQSTDGFSGIQFGAASDKPVPNASVLQ